jgi:hypothetical protein
MRLDELLGYKKYQNMSFNEFLKDIISKNKALIDKGKFSFVAIPKEGNFVYKCWFEDRGYEEFIKIVQAHQDNPFFPKLYGKVRKIPFFFKRPASIDGYLHVVKMEKLETADDKEGMDAVLDLLFMIDASGEQNMTDGEDPTKEKVLNQISKALSYANRDVERNQKINDKRRDDHVQHNSDVTKFTLEKSDYDLHRATEYKKHIEHNLGNIEKEIDYFVEALKLLHSVVKSEKVVSDMHDRNFMLRGHQIVITDPFVTNDDIDEILLSQTETKALAAEHVKFGRPTKVNQ